MKVIFTLCAIIAFVILCQVLFFSKYAEFNRAGIFGSGGRIENGSKFGILIGQEYEDVSDEMRSLGFEKSDLTKAGSCHGFDYPKELTPHLWFDNSWRKGTICVITESTKIRYVSWSYGFGFP